MALSRRLATADTSWVMVLLVAHRWRDANGDHRHRFPSIGVRQPVAALDTRSASTRADRPGPWSASTRLNSSRSSMSRRARSASAAIREARRCTTSRVFALSVSASRPSADRRPQLVVDVGDEVAAHGVEVLAGRHVGDDGHRPTRPEREPTGSTERAGGPCNSSVRDSGPPARAEASSSSTIPATRTSVGTSPPEVDARLVADHLATGARRRRRGPTGARRAPGAAAASGPRLAAAQRARVKPPLVEQPGQFARHVPSPEPSRDVGLGALVVGLGEDLRRRSDLDQAARRPRLRRW